MKTTLFLLLITQLSLYAQTVLTPEEAIALGLRQNFNIRIARNTAEIAANNVARGTAEFLPVIDASGSVQYASSDQETNSPFSFGKSSTHSFGAQLSLNWTLFDGFRMFIDRARYRELAELGEAQARRIIEENVVAILRAYFNVVQQEQLLEVARSTLQISEIRLNKEKTRREVGGASSTDLLNAQVSFNNDKSAFLNQELEVAIARKNLNILLGRDPASPFDVVKEISIHPLDLDRSGIKEMAFQRNSDLLIARRNQSISSQNLKLAKSAFSPRLLLNGSYAFSDRTVSSDSPRFPEDVTTESRDGNIGLTLSWNLFNGFRNRVDWQNARIEAKNQELAYENARLELAGLINEKYDTFHKRLEVVELEIQNVQAAQQNLQLQKERYEIGAATSLEFRDAQVNLARAQTTLIIAQYQARIVRLEIEQLIGNISID